MRDDAGSPAPDVVQTPPTASDLIRLTRPFTLLPPLLGVISGAVTAWGSASNPLVLAGFDRRWTWDMTWTVLVGSACAALLNAASNVVNQVYDIENDRINKPDRPLVTGRVGRRTALRFSATLYALAVLPTLLVVVFPFDTLGEKLSAPLAARQCFFIFLMGALLTFVYSAPAWGRTKAHPVLSNLTIALPRGWLLKVAGWSMVGSVLHPEPWFIGFIFFLFLLGASSTKDFSDMRGDAAAGCRTLPVHYGVSIAARAIAPFFVLPWILIPVGTWMRDPWHPSHPLLTGNPVVLNVLGVILAAWGAYTVRLLLRDPDDLARVENHPSWTHMYLMMMLAQTGFAAAYLF
jgi:4-hydroxybenzoate polyprenyltransferase